MKAMITEPVECGECTRIILPGDDASTYCGSVREEGCLDQHKRHCRVCDEGGEYTHDGIQM